MIDPRAAVGFERSSEAYERGRPSYPEAAVAHLASSLRIGPGKVVLDLGAGTGKLTRLLSGSGAELVAVEPVASMRDKLAVVVPTSRVLDGTAESIPMPDGAVDAVVVAQAFHWFRGASALTEIHRVVRPGGGLGLVWNVRDESMAWVARLSALLTPFESDTPRHGTGAWRRAFDETALFGPLRGVTFQYEQPLESVDALCDRVASISFVAALSTSERIPLLESVRRLGVENSAKSFPYRTHVYTCERNE